MTYSPQASQPAPATQVAPAAAPGTPAPAPAPVIAQDASGATTIQTPDGSYIVGPGGITSVPGGASPREVLRAAEARRSKLSDLMGRLRNRRDEVAQQLRNPRVDGADRAGLEKYLTQLDGRIIDLEQQLQASDHELAAVSGVPGALRPEPQRGGGGNSGGGVPEEFIAIPIVFTIFVLCPIAIAFARRIWKRTGTAVAQAPTWMNERFLRLEQSVDAIAVEVERISEGQRFMTKLFADNGRSLAQGAVQPLEVGVREPVGRHGGV